MLICILLCLSLFACKKEGDTVAPVVEITSPADGAQYDVGDTIHVILEVADDVALADVEVKLTDLNLTAVMPTVVLSTSGEGGTIQFDYFLDDVSVLSGTYYLQAVVHDAARNDAKDFVAVNITEVPRELKGVFAVTALPGFVTLHRIDTSWTAISLGTFAGDFTDLAVNAWWQQVAFTGSVTGITRCFSIDGVHAGWTINPLPTAGPYWGNLIAHERNWLINYRTDGLIKTTTYNNILSTSYTANSGYFFRNFAFSGERMFADMIDLSGTSRLIGVYQGGGGAIQQSVLSMDPVTILPRDESTVYIAGNVGNQGKLLIYDYDMNGTWEPIALPPGILLSATEINAGTLLLSMSNGNIYRFTYSPVGLIVWNSVTAEHIRYDDAGGTVITSEGTSIKQYDYPQTGVLDQFNLADSARDIELWYNR